MKRPIVVTGMGCISLLGNSAAAAGRSGIGPITRFDPSAFRIAQRRPLARFRPLWRPIMTRTESTFPSRASREQLPPPGLFQRGVQWLSRWAPGTAEAAGLLLFMTPPRRARRAPHVPGLPVRRILLRSGAFRLSAWEWGNGPAVLLIHGWGGQASQWDAAVPALVEAGYRVIAADLPAHGLSSGRRATLPDLVQAIGTVAWHAGRVQGVLAHSLGATATALALAHGLPAQRVVLVAPPVDMTYYIRRLAAWMRLPEPQAHGLVGRVTRRAGAPPSAFDLRTVTPGLETPALVIHSRGDREVPFSHGEAVAAAWPGARLLPLEGGAHTRILGDPAVIGAAVEFLGGVRSASAGVMDDGDRMPYRAAL